MPKADKIPYAKKDDQTDVFPAKRMSWGAVFAGAVIVMIVHLALVILGLAVGLTLFDPATEQDPAAGMGTGALIWWGISGLIALFIGGWTAGRLSGAWTRTAGFLHGFVTWAFVELVCILLFYSAVANLIGGAYKAVETTAGAAAGMVPQVIGAVAPNDVDVAWDKIKKEAKQILRQTEEKQLQPEQLEEEMQQAQETVGKAAEKAAQKPQQAYDEIMQAMDKLLRRAKDIISEVDKEAAVNILVKRTDMSRQQAAQTVDKWTKMYQQAKQQTAQTTKQLKQQAMQAAEKYGDMAADIGAKAAWWAFAVLILGALAAGLGGAVGAPIVVFLDKNKS